MTTIYTIQRRFTVEEDYDLINKWLIDSNCGLFEFTEVITVHYEYPHVEVKTTKRKVLIQKQHLVEVVGQPYAVTPTNP